MDAIIGGDDVRRPKPDPEGFVSACAAVKVPLDGSVYVGDIVDDMRMAAGRGYAVAQGLSSRGDLAPVAEKVFDTFFDLTEFLLNHDKKTVPQI